MYIKQYWLKRVWTNYLRRLFYLNVPEVEILWNVLWWKHWIEDKNKWIDQNKEYEYLRLEDVKNLICIRNPYWYILANYRYETNWKNKNIDLNNDFIKSCCALYNKHYKHWFSLNNLCVVRIEDLWDDYNKEINRVLKHYWLEEREIKNENNIINPSNDWKFNLKDKEFVIKDYFELDKLTKKQVDLINNIIDWSFFDWVYEKK